VDCEFLDDGRTIDLISMGIVRDDGAEYYAVNREAPWGQILHHPWLRDNVLPHLPQNGKHVHYLLEARWWLDQDHPDVRDHTQIAQEVATFIQQMPNPELWGWHPAYDFVALCQLWGPMVNRPPGIPDRVNDVRQEYARRGLTGADAPAQNARSVHNALHDARWIRQAHRQILTVGERGEWHEYVTLEDQHRDE
jgi:3' exoribonuclease, RNase T-like